LLPGDRRAAQIALPSVGFGLGPGFYIDIWRSISLDSPSGLVVCREMFDLRPTIILNSNQSPGSSDPSQKSEKK